jgi:hypothetical protein
LQERQHRESGNQNFIGCFPLDVREHVPWQAMDRVPFRVRPMLATVIAEPFDFSGWAVFSAVVHMVSA